MGATKRELERVQDCRSAATAIAVRAGLLERCEFCGDIRDPESFAFEDAYRLGNYLYTQGDGLTDGFADRREMTDLIKEAGETAPDLCHCRYLMAKDD